MSSVLMVMGIADLIPTALRVQQFSFDLKKSY
jgi:hypothetical protein